MLPANRRSWCVGLSRRSSASRKAGRRRRAPLRIRAEANDLLQPRTWRPARPVQGIKARGLLGHPPKLRFSSVATVRLRIQAQLRSAVARAVAPKNMAARSPATGARRRDDDRRSAVDPHCLFKRLVCLRQEALGLQPEQAHGPVRAAPLYLSRRAVARPRPYR